MPVVPPNYGMRYTADFAAVWPAVAKATGAPLIGFFLQGVALDPALMQADGTPGDISAADLAVALVDALEQQAHVRQRFTVAY